MKLVLKSVAKERKEEKSERKDDEEDMGDCTCSEQLPQPNLKHCPLPLFHPSCVGAQISIIK